VIDRPRLAVLGGLLAAVGGFALWAVPGAGGGLVTDIAGIAVVVVAGAVALRLAAGELLDREVDTLTTPTPESRPGYRTPGEEFARLIDGVSLVGRRDVDSAEETPRERLHGTLRELAIDTLGRTEGWSRGTAADRLAEGAWTDDDAAASFFAGSDRPPVSRLAYLPVGDPDLPIARRGRHVVTSLAGRLGESVPDPDAETDPPPVRSTGNYWPTGEFPRQRSTGLTGTLTAAVLAVSVLGVWFGRPGVVLVATLGLAVVAAASLQSPSATVELSRSLSAGSPDAGEQVTVTVTVRNVGDRTLPDLRLIDGVPAGITVVEGSPRFTTALRPGTARTFTYAIAAVPGRHTFEPALVVAGDGIGATETVTTAEVVDGPTELDCGFDRPAGGADAPRPQVTVDPGRRVGDASGSGVEFDTHREYRPGDPPARIDWNHRAKTGELSTIQFREPRLSRVAVVVDARPAAYVAATSGGIPGPRHGAVAAFRIASRLLAEGVPIGFGPLPAGEHWTPAGAGAEQQTRLRECLAADGAVPWVPPADSPPVSDVVTALTARLDPDVQVVFVSPCCDDEAVEIARRINAEGHSVTVVSPDCTDASTVDGTYGRLTRWHRLSTLRDHGIPVRDWTPGDGTKGFHLPAEGRNGGRHQGNDRNGVSTGARH
jgi:uncharacterized repeat protein (TIGR01451 family)